LTISKPCCIIQEAYENRSGYKLKTLDRKEIIMPTRLVLKEIHYQEDGSYKTAMNARNRRRII
jgi:hypothetical protein